MQRDENALLGENWDFFPPTLPQYHRVRCWCWAPRLRKDRWKTLKVKPLKVRLLEVTEMEQGAKSNIVHPPSPDSILPKPHPGKRGCGGEASSSCPNAQVLPA